MAGFIVDNNLESLVADNPLAAGAVTLNISPGEGTNFPSTFPFRLTIWDEATYTDPTDDPNMEIVECTGRTVDALTITRAKESTIDVQHVLGERVGMLITAGMFNDPIYGIQPQIDAVPVELVNAASVSLTTIAFVNSNPDTITDSASGFLTAGFEPGQIIIVTTTSGTNDGVYTIASVAAGTITLIAADSLTTENAATAGTVAMSAGAIQPKSVNNIIKVIDLDGDSYMQIGFELDDVGLLQLIGGDKLRIRLNKNLFLHNYGTGTFFAGEQAGNVSHSASGAVGVGHKALNALTSGDYNTALGQNALLNITTGLSNTALGNHAASHYTGSESVIIGAHSLYSIFDSNTGSKNTIVGYSIGYLGAGLPNDFEDCVIMGHLAAKGIESGHRNTIIGSKAGSAIQDNLNCIMLGYYSGYYESASNKLFIDSLDRTDEATGRIQSLIYGKINANPALQELHFNAKVQAHGVIPLSKTDNYTIALDDFGKSLRMNNAATKTFTFPSVGANDDGARLTICKSGAGQVTLQMVDSDKIHDSSATGTMLNSQAGETYATVTVEYCHDTVTWNLISSVGTWTTT